MSATPEPGATNSESGPEPLRSGSPEGESLEEAAARLEALAPGYLDRIRHRAAQMGVPTTPAGRAERAVAMVVATARINPDVPAESRRRSTRLLKRAVGVLTRFYFMHVTEQVTEFGESTSWMGTALCQYIEGLETEVAELRERVARLEQSRSHP